MAKDILAVYDACQSYIERFFSYAHTKKNLKFELEGFTDLTILRNALKNNKIKAVLFSQSETDNQEDPRVKEILTECMKWNDLIVFLLGEQPAAGETEPKNVHRIWKYQSMETILAEIEQKLGKENKEPGALAVPAGFHVSGLYSPLDKKSHPEQAALLARHLQGEQEGGASRCLYLNLEPFSGMAALLEDPADISISNIIYYYKTNPSKLGESLRKRKGSFQGMDVLTAPVELEDLEEIGKKGWPAFLAALSNAGDYPNILIDTVLFNRELLDVIFEYGNLYIPALPYSEKSTRSSLIRSIPQEENPAIAREKMKEFRSFLTSVGEKEWMEKVWEIHYEL